MIYIVKNGEQISDVVMNATGNISNWEAVLKANGFTEWVPVLYPGQKITIPNNAIIQTGVKSILINYPANNNSNISDMDSQISSIMGTLEGSEITIDSGIVTIDNGVVTVDS
jgi:phage tail protein X